MSAILFSGLSFLIVEPEEAVFCWLWASTKEKSKTNKQKTAQTFLGIPSESPGLERLVSDKDVSRLSAKPRCLRAKRGLRATQIRASDQRAFHPGFLVSRELVTLYSQQLSGNADIQFLAPVLQVILELGKMCR